MIPAYAKKLGHTLWKISVGAQKIDSSPLETHGMASASFSLQDSQGKVQFFEETFLLVDISIEVIPKFRLNTLIILMYFQQT